MKHIHAENRVLYAADELTTDKPWMRWEFKEITDDTWLSLRGTPHWHVEHQYRRKPKQHTIVLTTKQLEEVIAWCSIVECDGDDFYSAVQILTKALNGE
jgi:hypothetical protein